MSTSHKSLISELEAELSSILGFWMRNTIDLKHGGFVGEINEQNSVVSKASKGSVLTSRILWTFSTAFLHTRDASHRKTAKRAFNYLLNHFWDNEFGGLFWEVDHLGNLLSDRKQMYAQGFGIYGLSEYYRATSDKQALERAIELFQVIELYGHDTEHGGYIEALSRDWSDLEDMRLSEKDANAPKSMNTHLHILEPYTNLYRVWQNNRLKSKISELINIFLDHIYSKNEKRLDLFFERDWTRVSSITSYGHDIEAAWLLSEAAETIRDSELQERTNKVALRLAEAVMQEGLDRDGSLFYEWDQNEQKLDDDKHWWPQAEAMVGFLNAHEISGKEKYLKAMVRVWRFIGDKIIDQEQGEWCWSVDREGITTADRVKVGFWKCPYHNSRACLESIRRLHKIYN